MSKKIPLGKGKFAIIDNEDYPVVSRHTWFAHKIDRAIIPVKSFWIGDILVHMRLADFIMPVKHGGNVIRNFNGDVFDCRKCNLVEMNHKIAQHRTNKRKVGTTSIYKGVCYYKWGKDKKWVACIRFNHKDYKKAFDTEREAAIYYNKLAKQFYGELAYQNKIE
jgi:hypothetical protein